MKIHLPLLLGIGFLVRLVALLVYLATHNWQGEQWEYEVIAQNLLNGRGFVIERYNTLYHALVPPVFPFICFFLHVIGGTGASYLALYYTYHIGVALGIIWLTYRLALAWFGRSVATLSALFVALEPGLVIYQSYKMDVITLATFLLLAAVALFQRLSETRELRAAAALGVIIGLGLLTRLDLLILVGLLGTWLISERREAAAILKPVAVTLVVAFLVVTPWIVRNYVVLDRLMFISSNSGEWLWLGNNANSIGTPAGLDGRSVLEVAPASLKQSLAAATSEFEVNAIFMKEAVLYITEDPWRYARLAAAKFWYFWWFTPTYGWQYPQIPGVWQLSYKVVHGAVLGFAILGIWRTLCIPRRESTHAVLSILTVCLLLAALHSLTYVEGRHRLLVEPLLLILAAAGVQAAWRWAKQGVVANTCRASSEPAGPPIP